MYEALKSRHVKGVLIDAFTVGSRRKLFNRTDLRINKILAHKSAYGIVLGGEGKKLQTCFNNFLNQQRSQVSKIIESNVVSIEVRNVSALFSD